MILIFRTTVFYTVYVLTIPLHAAVSIVLGVLLPLHKRFYLFTRWNRFAIFWLRVCCGIHLQIRGAENIPQEPYVLLSNHQSPWETIYFYERFRPITAILKRELLWIPFFGWALALLHPIPIDRSNKRKARQAVLDKGTRLLRDKGVSVLIFPEGTRVDPGVEKRFSAGGAELAINAGVKVLPVAHNAGHCWPARRFIKYPGTITVVVGQAIDSKGKTPKELATEVETWVRTAI
ncbi:MAG: lysophospholipid acyltransferase family protein [Pseudohongiellaceae bacterium]